MLFIMFSLSAVKKLKYGCIQVNSWYNNFKIELQSFTSVTCPIIFMWGRNLLLRDSEIVVENLLALYNSSVDLLTESFPLAQGIL